MWPATSVQFFVSTLPLLQAAQLRELKVQLKEIKASRKRLLGVIATTKADQEANIKGSGKKTTKVPVAVQRKLDELEVCSAIAYRPC